MLNSRVAVLSALVAGQLLLTQPTLAGDTFESTSRLTLTGHLVAKVRIQDDGPPHTSCEPWRDVLIQRKRGGRWTRVATGTTGPWESANGTESQPWGVYRTGIPDRAGQYRAVATRKGVDGGVCIKAISEVVRHSH